jgi:antitoxin component YwqK of YwqJK toxin-antitoxin module
MKRPAGVPEAAEWSEKDQEWILGERDSAGDYTGLVKYWRPDGTLVSECPHLRGKPHGLARRFHEGGQISQTAEYEHGKMNGKRVWFACTDGTTTTEKMRTPDMGKNVMRVEVNYKNDIAHGFRFFDGDGLEVDRSGTPLAPRPASVPEGAIFRKAGSVWIDGHFLESGEPDGPSRSFDENGALIATESFRNGKRHGLLTIYDFRGSGAKRLAVEFHEGELHGSFEVFWPDGKTRRRTRFANDAFAAPLEDFDANGASLPRIEIPEIAPAPAVAPAGESDLATLIATGWGGGDDRDAGEARAARALVRQEAPAGVRAKLAELGLDRAPRLLTEARVERVLRELAAEGSIDASALERAFIAQGGPALGVALRQGGGAAVSMLESKRNGKRLNLSSLAISELPPLIARFPSVEELVLEHNRLTTLPREIGALVYLRKLELGHNPIGSLPPELARLTELRSLHLQECELEALPEGLCALTGLETLNLGGNQLTTLPPEFGALTELHTVWLHDSPLTTLPRELTRLHRLSFLHLGDVAWEEPPSCLWEIPSLEELWLAGPNLKRLPPDVARLPKLRRLCLWYSSLEEIPEVLYGMTHLRELRISHNPLPDGVVKRLKEALPACTIY